MREHFNVPPDQPIIVFVKGDQPSDWVSGKEPSKRRSKKPVPLADEQEPLF